MRNAAIVDNSLEWRKKFYLILGTYYRYKCLHVSPFILITVEKGQLLYDAKKKKKSNFQNLNLPRDKFELRSFRRTLASWETTVNGSSGTVRWS